MQHYLLLVDNSYLDSRDSKTLQQVSVNPLLEKRSEKVDRIIFCQLSIVLIEV